MEQHRWRPSRYHRLKCCDQKRARVHGRAKGVKLTRYRKLTWKPFSIMFSLSRNMISKIVAGFVRRMKMDEASPAITFSCQWGLPILSHSSSLSIR